MYTYISISIYINREDAARRDEAQELRESTAALGAARARIGEMERELAETARKYKLLLASEQELKEREEALQVRVAARDAIYTHIIIIIIIVIIIV